MKKLLFAFMFLASLATCFTSCNKDDYYEPSGTFTIGNKKYDIMSANELHYGGQVEWSFMDKTLSNQIVINSSYELPYNIENSVDSTLHVSAIAEGKQYGAISGTVKVQLLDEATEKLSFNVAVNLMSEDGTTTTCKLSYKGF